MSYLGYVNPLHRLGRNLSALLGGLVDISSSVDRMGRVALLFQTAQHRPHRRFLERSRQLFPHRLRRDRTMGPNQLHHLALEVSEFGQAVVHG